jgi:hypothetical protein
LSLAEQIPALIQHDLDPLEPVAVSLIRVAVGLPLEEFVLLSRKLIDVVTDLFVVHGFSPMSVGAGAQSFSRSETQSSDCFQITTASEWFRTLRSM